MHTPRICLLRKFFAATTVAAVAVLLLLLLNLAYLYGSVYHQTERGAALYVLLVGYNGEVVGRSLSAYQHLKSPSFPTLFSQPPSQYPKSDTIIQAVRNRQYWAAIFTSPGASQRLSAALQGGPAATTYNKKLNDKMLNSFQIIDFVDSFYKLKLFGYKEGLSQWV